MEIKEAVIEAIKSLIIPVNFNMKKFEALELQIFNILEEIRDIRRVLEKKVDLDELRRLENNYLELLKEITFMKTKLPA